MSCARSAILALFALLLLPVRGDAAPASVVGTFSLPGAARPLALIEGAPGSLLVGTARSNAHPELFAIEIGTDGRSLALAWSLEIGAHVNALATDGRFVYAATSANVSELVVVDSVDRRVVARWDAPGPADARTVRMLEPGVVQLGRRRGPGPELLSLDVSDPFSIVVLDAREEATAVRPVRPKKAPWLPRYRGRLQARLDRATPRGFLHYLALTDRNAELTVVERDVPVVFPDVNDDGIFRLGCVGDSNSVDRLVQPSWCTLLEERLDDPDFEVVNVSVSGGTVAPNRVFPIDVAQQMEAVLAHAPDALVLSFGTNDLLQNRAPTEVRDAYLAQQAVAAAAGVAFYVAKTPPIGPCQGFACFYILASNLLLDETFPGRLLEFYDGFGITHLHDDWVHLNAAGQMLRATRAFEVLANPFVHDAP